MSKISFAIAAGLLLATRWTSAAAEPPPPGGATPARKATPEDRAKAKELLEQGRALQREKGEGGAEEAIKIYESAAALDPELAAAHWEIGWSYQLLSEWDRVIEAWDKVRTIDPKFPDLEKQYPVALKRRDQARALKDLPDPGVIAAPDEKPKDGPRIRIAAVGDVQLGRAWPEERAELPPDDAKDVLVGMHPALAAADIAFGNLETVLADSGKSSKCGPRSSKCFAFRVPTRFAEALKAAGFKVMSTANNHAGDFGPDGRVSTMAALDKVGIKHSGIIGDIASFEVKGVKFGLIGFSTGAGVYRIQDFDLARKIVAETARDHDVVIVSFHGGAEGVAAAHVTNKPEIFFGEDRGEVKKFAHTVIDAGADLVLGHGPHLQRAMEIYKGRFIVYSLGNFSTWETFNLSGPLGVGAVVYIELAPNGVVTKIETEPYFIDKPGRPQPDPQKRGIELVRQLSKEDFGNALLDEQGKWAREARKPGK